MFHVVGANPLPRSIKRLNNTRIEGVRRVVVHGYVADLKQVCVCAGGGVDKQMCVVYVCAGKGGWTPPLTHPNH